MGGLDMGDVYEEWVKMMRFDMTSTAVAATTV